MKICPRTALLILALAAAQPAAAELDPCAGPAPKGTDDPFEVIEFAFVCGKPIPKDVKLADPDETKLYGYVKEAVEACPPSAETKTCRPQAQIEPCRKIIGVLAGGLRLPAPQVKKLAPIYDLPACPPYAVGGSKPVPGEADKLKQQEEKQANLYKRAVQESKSLASQIDDLGGGATGIMLDENNKLINDPNGKLPKIKGKLDEIAELLAFMDKPLLEMTPDELSNGPAIAAKLKKLDALFAKAAKFQKAAGNDPSAKAFGDQRQELLTKKTELEDKLKLMSKLKIASEGVGAKLAPFEKSGDIKDLPSRKDLERIFAAAGLDGPAKAAAMKDLDALYAGAGAGAKAQGAEQSDAAPAKTYHDYFGDKLKDKKIAKLVADAGAFNRAIGSCLQGSSSAFDGAAMAKLQDGPRDDLFQCGVVVLQQDAELDALTAQKAKQGRRFKGQARIDELLKFGVQRGRRGLQTSAPDAPAPDASAVSGDLTRDLTVAALASLVEMPGLPDAVRKRAAGRLFHEMDSQYLEAQAGKAHALLGAYASDDPAFGALRTSYEELQKGRETAGYKDRLRDWMHAVDAALAKSKGGKLGQETAARTSYAEALIAAKRAGEALQKDSAIQALFKANPGAAALLDKDPKDLTEKEDADLKALHEKMLGHPVYRDYLKARDAALSAGASLDDVQAAMPDLAAYRKAAAERSALLQAYQARGFIPDGTEFTARELGLPGVPPDSKVVKDKEAGLDGLWVYPPGASRVFSSFDGTLVADSIPNKGGEILRWRRYDGQGRVLTMTLKGKGPDGPFVEEDKFDPKTGNRVLSTVKGDKRIVTTKFDPKTEKVLVVEERDSKNPKGKPLLVIHYADDGGWTMIDAAKGSTLKVEGAADKDGARAATQTQGHLEATGKFKDNVFTPERTDVVNNGTKHLALFNDSGAVSGLWVNIDPKQGGVDWDDLAKSGILPQADAMAFKQLAGSLRGMTEGEFRAPDVKERLAAVKAVGGNIYTFGGEPKLVKLTDGHWALKYKTAGLGYQNLSYTISYQDGRWVEIVDDGTGGKGWSTVTSYTGQRSDGVFEGKETFNHCMTKETYKGSTKGIIHGNCHRVYQYNAGKNDYDVTLDDSPKDSELSRWDMMGRGLSKTFDSEIHNVERTIGRATGFIADRGIDLYYGISSGAEEVTRPSRFWGSSPTDDPGRDTRSIVYGVLTKYQMPMFSYLDKKRQAVLMMEKLHDKLPRAEFDKVWDEWVEDYRKSRLKAAEGSLEAYSARYDKPTEEEIGVWLIDGQGSGGLKGAGALFAKQAADSDSVIGKIGWGAASVGTYGGEFVAMSVGFQGVGTVAKGFERAAEVENAGKSVQLAAGMLKGYEKVQATYFQAMLGHQAMRVVNAVAKDDKYELADSLAQAGGLLIMPGGDHKRSKERGLEGTTFKGMAREVLTTGMGYKMVTGTGGLVMNLAARFGAKPAPAPAPATVVEGGAVFPEPPDMASWKPKEVRDWYAANWGTKGKGAARKPVSVEGEAVFPEPPDMTSWKPKERSDWYAANWGVKGKGGPRAPPSKDGAVFPDPPNMAGWKPKEVRDWYAANWGTKGGGSRPPQGKDGSVFPEPPDMAGWKPKQVRDWYAANWGTKGKGVAPDSVPVEGEVVFPVKPSMNGWSGGKVRDWLASKWGIKGKSDRSGVKITSPEVVRVESSQGPRDIIVVETANGKQAMYRSTGENSGKPGEWLPFDGILEQGVGPLGEGWYDKSAYVGSKTPKGSPLHRYGTPELLRISQELGRMDIPAGRVVDAPGANAAIVSGGAELGGMVKLSQAWRNEANAKEAKGQDAPELAKDPAPEPAAETPTDPDATTRAGKPGTTPKPAGKVALPDPVPQPWSKDTVKPEQTVAEVPYDRRVSALEKNAVIRDGNLVENAASGPLDGHGSVLMRERYDPTSKAQRERVARLNKLGFEVEFSREAAGGGSKKPAPADPVPQPWSKDTVKPEQTVADVPYDRRVSALEKNAVIRDDALVENVDSGPLHGRGTVLMREAYEPNSKAQRERIARLNKLGFEVEFPREPKPIPERAAKLKPDAEPVRDTTAVNTAVGTKPNAPADAVTRVVAWARSLYTANTEPAVANTQPANTLPAKKPGKAEPAVANTEPLIANTEPAKPAAKPEKPGVPENIKNDYVEAPDLNRLAGQGILYRSRDGKKIVKTFKLGEKSTSREAVEALVAHNQRLRDAGVNTVPMKAVEVAPGVWGIEMPLVEGQSMAEYIDKDWNEDTGHSALAIERLKKADAILDKIDAMTAKDPSKPGKDHLTDHRGREMLEDGTIIRDREDYANFIIDKSGEVVNIDPLNMAGVMKRGGPPRGRAPPDSAAPKSKGAGPVEKTEPLPGQKERMQSFMESEQFKAIKPPSMHSLPKGIEPRFRKGLDAIRRLLGHKSRFFKAMQALEVEVAQRVKATGEKPEVALDFVLDALEKKHGFKPFIEVHEGLAPKPFRDMLLQGALFKDMAFEGSKHGQETHRLQWYAIMRAMEADPAAFGEITKASEFYKYLGKVDNKALEWNGTGADQFGADLWFELFDQPQPVGNWSSPEFTRPMKNHWPGLGEWK